MAKRKTGSLQQKNGWWYFVARDQDGRVRWKALHTQDKREADKRASLHLGAALRSDDREAWLQNLVEMGKWAEKELVGADARAARAGLTWDGLFDTWLAAAKKLTVHAQSLLNYEILLKILFRWAKSHELADPAAFSATDAQSYVQERAKKNVSTDRDVALFKRVWRDLGLDNVWNNVRLDVRTNKIRTRYRRLTVDEVRQVVKVLREGRKPEPNAKGGNRKAGSWTALPDMADLVVIGYHTALRRGDCSKLTTDNVDGDFLRVIPAKTENRKGHVLLIPLQPEVREVIHRRKKEAEGENRKEMFPNLTTNGLSKCVERTWSRAKVQDNDFGRASFHSLRATFISAMDEAGVPPHVCDAITGHAPAGMHGRYSQPGRDALMDAVKRAIVPLGV